MVEPGGDLIADRETNEKLSCGLAEALNLGAEPVAITYKDEPHPEGDSRKRYVCVALKHAFKGKTINLSREILQCLGGVHWLGFMDLEELLVAFLVMMERSFEDSDVARRWFRSVPAPPFGRAEFVVLQPLGECTWTPDLVAVKIKPRGAGDLLSMLTFSNAEFTLDARFSATCQGVVTNPISTGRPSLCFPDEISRKFAKFDDDDLIVSLPFRRAGSLLDDYPAWRTDIEELFALIVETTRMNRGPEAESE